MKLTELSARFVVLEQAERGLVFRGVDTLAEAQGVEFLCPCDSCRNGGEWSSIDRVRVFFKSNPANYQLWTVSGSTLEDLTLSPSILTSASGGCVEWHGWCRNGDLVVA